MHALFFDKALQEWPCNFQGCLEPIIAACVMNLRQTVQILGIAVCTLAMLEQLSMTFNWRSSTVSYQTFVLSDDATDS